MSDIPNGIERVRRSRGATNRHYSLYKVGRMVYEYELDMSEFPFDRDFEVEWVDGPVRFRFERCDDKDAYKFWAFPAGKGGSVKQQDDYSHTRGRTSGSHPYSSTLVSAPWDLHNSDSRDTYDGPTTAQVTFTIDLAVNPFMLEFHTPSDVSDEATFFTFGGILEVATKHNPSALRNEKYNISKSMVASQLRYLASDVVRKPLYELRENSVKDIVSHYWNSRSMKQRREKVRNTFKEMKWKLGGDKPEHVKVREHQEQYSEGQQQEPPALQRDQPIIEEKDNMCPECSGRFHKKDLKTVEVDDGNISGKKYECPDCGAVVGEDIDYHGPVPVETPHGTELQ